MTTPQPQPTVADVRQGPVLRRPLEDTGVTLEDVVLYCESRRDYLQAEIDRGLTEELSASYLGQRALLNYMLTAIAYGHLPPYEPPPWERGAAETEGRDE